jgi:very-short-patch-repair endonuclease/uncharacterized Zn finger protein (UPF0148 family)
MLKLKCDDCGKILWRTHASKDDNTICSNCYIILKEKENKRELIKKELKEKERIEELEKEKKLEEKTKIERKNKIDNLYNEIHEKGLHELIYNFIKKYPNETGKKFDTLIKLIENNYKINVEKGIFIDVMSRVKEIYDEKLEIDALEKELMDNKKTFDKNFKCDICKKEIDEKMFYYSKYMFNKSLCLDHQGTKTQKELFIALKNRDLDCEYEPWDGHKHVDIAIHNAKLYIEIDGKHHIDNQKQFFADLKRDYHSMENGYFTRRIGNKDVEKNLDEIADSIANLVIEKI